MSINESIQKLDDRTALLVVSHLTEQLREEMSENERTSVQNIDEARQAIASFIEEQGARVPSGSADLAADPVAEVTQARALIQLLWDDEAMRPRVEKLVSHPPDDSQRSVEIAFAAAIILGGLITWLQTKVEIDVTRKDGKTDFHFKLKKEGASEDLLRTMVDPIKSIALSV